MCTMIQTPPLLGILIVARMGKILIGQGETNAVYDYENGFPEGDGDAS